MSTTQPTYSDRALHHTLLAVTALFVLFAPLCIYVLTDVGPIHRLWVAFLAANLLGWVGLLVVAAARRGVQLARSLSASAGRSDSRDGGAQGDMALEA